MSGAVNEAIGSSVSFCSILLSHGFQDLHSQKFLTSFTSQTRFQVIESRQKLDKALIIFVLCDKFSIWNAICQIATEFNNEITYSLSDKEKANVIFHFDSNSSLFYCTIESFLFFL